MLMMKRSRATRPHAILTACLSIVLAGSLQARDLVVKVDEAQLLSACSERASGIASLPQGQRVQLRFVIAGAAGPCYSVSTEIGGKHVRGYISKESLAGLEDFERSRRSASASRVVDSTIVTLGLGSTQAAHPEATSEDDSPALQAAVLEAVAMLKRKQPAEAERILAAAGAPAGASSRGASALPGPAPARAPRPGVGSRRAGPRAPPQPCRPARHRRHQLISKGRSSKRRASI